MVPAQLVVEHNIKKSIAGSVAAAVQIGFAAPPWALGKKVLNAVPALFFL